MITTLNKLKAHGVCGDSWDVVERLFIKHFEVEL